MLLRLQHVALMTHHLITHMLQISLTSIPPLGCIESAKSQHFRPFSHWQGQESLCDPMTFVRGGVSQHVALRADPFLPLSVGVVDYAEYGEPFKLSAHGFQYPLGV